MNCTLHVGIEMVPLPAAPHRHFQTAADPESVADVARVDLRCPVPGCRRVASEFANAANKKDCRRCGKPVEEWRAHTSAQLCKRCTLQRQEWYNRRSRQRAGARAANFVHAAQRRGSLPSAISSAGAVPAKSVKSADSFSEASA